MNACQELSKAGLLISLRGNQHRGLESPDSGFSKPQGKNIGQPTEELAGYFSASDCFIMSAGTSCCFIRLL